MRARCADGPYAGQVFEFPNPYKQIHWNNYDYPDDPYTGVLIKDPAPPEELPVGPLVWIINGVDRHAYSLRENHPYGGWRLVYRDTF